MSIIDADRLHVVSMSLAETANEADIRDYLDHVAVEFGVPLHVTVDHEIEVVGPVLRWAHDNGVDVTIGREVMLKVPSKHFHWSTHQSLVMEIKRGMKIIAEGRRATVR